MKGLPIGLLPTAPRCTKHGAGRGQGLVDTCAAKDNAHRIAVAFSKGQLAHALEVVGKRHLKPGKKRLTQGVQQQRGLVCLWAFKPVGGAQCRRVNADPVQNILDYSCNDHSFPIIGRTC